MLSYILATVYQLFSFDIDTDWKEHLHEHVMTIEALSATVIARVTGFEQRCLLAVKSLEQVQLPMQCTITVTV